MTRKQYLRKMKTLYRSKREAGTIPEKLRIHNQITALRDGGYDGQILDE